MSNRPRRRHGRITPRPNPTTGGWVPAATSFLDELDDTCIFCRLAELVDHLHRVAIPGTRDLSDDGRVRAHGLADQIQAATAELLDLLAGHGPTHQR